MRKFIYADNFRGFSNTYIPLVDVNFLVGENSTGKMSALDLLRVFSNPGLSLGVDVLAGGHQAQFDGESKCLPRQRGTTRVVTRESRLSTTKSFRFEASTPLN